MIQLGSFHTDLVNNTQLGSPLPKRSRLSLKRATLCPPQNHVKVEPAPQLIDSGYATECLKNTLSSSRTVPPENATIESKEVPSAQSNAASDNQLTSSNSFLGLPNCGNTCFINSVLQVLRFTPNFLISLHQLIEIGRQSEKLSSFENEIKEIIFFDHLHDLYVAMKRRESVLKNKRREIRVIPKPLKAFILSLREICLLFEEGEQHDAHEFLLTVISSFASSCKTIKKIRDNANKEKVYDCHVTTLCQEITTNLMEELATIEQAVKQKSILTKRKAVGRSPKAPKLICQPQVGNVDDLTLGFKGKLRITAKCLECESRREKEDIFYDLGFPFAHDSDTEDTVDLRNCLAQHCHSVMRDENKVNCDECCRKNETKMSSEVISTPPVLLLHLTDSSCSSGFYEKAVTKVAIPLSLQTSENTEIFDCEENQTYSLYAIVVHIGLSTEAGHYVAFIRDNQHVSTAVVDEAKPSGNAHTPDIERCCATAEILNRQTVGSSNKWFLFDDENVSLVCTEEGEKTFPYYNYVGVTASPKMIFYCKN